MGRLRNSNCFRVSDEYDAKHWEEVCNRYGKYVDLDEVPSTNRSEIGAISSANELEATRKAAIGDWDPA